VDKVIVSYVCNNCGTHFPRWQGQCNVCLVWNAIEEECISKTALKKQTKAALTKNPIPIIEVKPELHQVYPTKIGELDSVLGGGLFLGSIVLLGGEPGIGKSTIALQIAQNIAKQNKTVLYVSGEETEAQLFYRAKRLGESAQGLLVYAETNIRNIVQVIEKQQPDLVILDSIQVVYQPEIPSIPGSVNQIRQCANEIINIIKEKNIIGLLIGHITKEGNIAGPKLLEHIVDVILYFDGERDQQYRLLRSFKNRYAPTNEIGLFKMQKDGLKDIPNPSELFIDENTLMQPGSVVSSMVEGSRVILLEIQALVVESGYGMAKRTFLGVEPNRANLMIAAMEKILGIKLSNKDIIINIIGGMKVKEPTLDLAIVIALLSSLTGKVVGKKLGFMGEVGLTGEIRPVTNVEERIQEFKKLGFVGCVLPESKKNIESSRKQVDFEMITVKSIKTVFDRFFN
jgi:DNA repair protein RadA/Sms